MLKGSTNEEKIWNFLKGAGLNDCGAAGLMGNLYAESGLRPDNLQNSYEKKLGYTDASYTAAVDSGAYAGFVKDCAGYGWPAGGAPWRRQPGGRPAGGRRPRDRSRQNHRCGSDCAGRGWYRCPRQTGGGDRCGWVHSS